MKFVETLRDRFSGLLRHVFKPRWTVPVDGSAEEVDPAVVTKREQMVAAIIGVVVLLALVGGGVWYARTHRTEPVRPDARGYTLTPPEGWAKVSPTPEGTSVAFAASTADSDDSGTLKAYIAVQSTALNAQAKKAAFKDLAQSYVTQLASSYTDFESLATDYKTIAGLPAVLESFSFKSGETIVTTRSLFIVKDGISYAVNGEALTSAWPQHADIIEKSLLTFRP